MERMAYRDPSSRSMKGSTGLCFSLIVPTYNEVDNIAELVSRVEVSCKDLPFEMIFVDDGSTDGTVRMLEMLMRTRNNMKVLRRPKKLGLASAILAGASLASSKIIAVMDADLQHPPELLPLLYHKIAEDYDVVIASRYVKGGGIKGWSLLRRAVSKCAIWMTHLLIPEIRQIKDPLSGYFMARSEVLADLGWCSEGFKVLVSILCLARHRSVVEVPYTFESRRKGRSKFNVKEVFTYAKLLLKLKLGRMGRYRGNAQYSLLGSESAENLTWYGLV